MSLSWHQRKNRLVSLLKSHGDEDAEGGALDRLMHGQSVIGKTAKTTEIDTLRFKDSDLHPVGTLEYGQFGIIDVVTCRLNGAVYVRKSIEKRFALRTRDQCSPQFERDLLLQALKTDSPWAPHLLCAFQTPTHLNLVMDYAEGGTLWDVLESSPHDGRVLELDLRWWAPQIVSAIDWCHSQGFTHRDIKPHNFVLTPDAHILLIDFGSAAPLLPPKSDGSRLIAKRYCLVPCGTCDYISPEILQAHEEALVALEMEDEDDIVNFAKPQDIEGYGVETDWWSLGAMLYEMAYGFAPFFANDIRQTYIRIMNHEKSLRFEQKVDISPEYQHFLRRLLTHAKQRLGRRNVTEITIHPFFNGVDWVTLSKQVAPAALHLPQFTYSDPKPSSAPRQDIPAYEDSRSLSQGFAFSAFFQASSSVSPGLSILRPSPVSGLHSSISRESSSAASSFIGFSWGPQMDAFPADFVATQPTGEPRPLLRTPLRGPHQSPRRADHTLSVPLNWGSGTFATPGALQSYSTPMKPYALSPYATLPRTGTVRRTAPRRSVSDREAMKQLVDCVGMSARKKVLESGRKPKILGVFGVGNTGGRHTGSTGTNLRTGSGGTMRKELRFDRFTTPIPRPDYSGASSGRSRALSDVNPTMSKLEDDSDIYPPQDVYAQNPDIYASSESTDSDGGGPPSPSPSPRPGSAMSMMSMSRRSATPTFSGYFNGPGRMRSGSGSGLLSDRSVTATLTTTSSGLSSIPSGSALGLGLKDRQPPNVPMPGKNERVADATQNGQTRPTFVPPPPRPPSPETIFELRDMRGRGSTRNASPRRLEHLPPNLWFGELETRHFQLIQDIEALEERLDRVSSVAGS